MSELRAGIYGDENANTYGGNTQESSDEDIESGGHKRGRKGVINLVIKQRIILAHIDGMSNRAIANNCENTRKKVVNLIG